MCKSNHCRRNGCEKHVPENRTDGFCSNACKVLKTLELRDSYKELRIAELPLNLRQKREKKICANEGCNNIVTKRGKKAKYCSLSCSSESKRKYKVIPCENCSTPFKSERFRTHFCSRQCYIDSVSVKRYCENSECGKLLSNVGGIKKYCSIACYRKIKGAGLVRFDNCQSKGCENKLTAFQRKNGQKFCSKSCYHKNRIESAGDGFGKISLRKEKGWEYPRRFIKTERGWILLSRYTWEQANGPLPPYHIIVCKDGNTFNDSDINNLEIIHISKIGKKKKSPNNSEELQEKTASSGEFFSLKDLEM